MENEPRREYGSQRRDYDDRPRGNYDERPRGNYDRDHNPRPRGGRGGFSHNNQSRGFNRERPSNYRSDSKDGRQPLSYSFSDDRFQPQIPMENFEPIKKDFYVEHENTAKRTEEENLAFMAKN
jgi:hypothetical protein